MAMINPLFGQNNTAYQQLLQQYMQNSMQPQQGVTTFINVPSEEAARRAADLYEQDLPIMSYNEDTEVDGQHHFCQEFGAELFKDGVKWAINEFQKSLCHPASEVPQIGRGRVLAYSIDYCLEIFTTYTI